MLPRPMSSSPSRARQLDHDDRRCGGGAVTAAPGSGPWHGVFSVPRRDAEAAGWQIALLSRARMRQPALRREDVEQRAEGHVSGDVGQVGIVPA